ncbi:hypothetical protein ACU4GD_09970 [Cupriavidus basilensis]
MVIRSYRHRQGLAPRSYPQHEATEKKAGGDSADPAPATITLDGTADGVVPATDGNASAARSTGPRHAGRFRAMSAHNLPQEAPEEHFCRRGDRASCAAAERAGCPGRSRWHRTGWRTRCPPTPRAHRGAAFNGALGVL